MEQERKIGVLLNCGTPKRVDWIKKFIDEIQKMKYNLLELDISCTYKIENEPYFGYLLGSYSTAELQEIDEYAFARGIEVVPCIQTLGHLGGLKRIPEYSSIMDINDILMIDEPRTYELIENMFKALRKAFKSKLVNIGYDEAHLVGRGKYLDRHGYANGYELLLKHLHKVVDIAEKYDFKVHMWSDMFVRVANKGLYYGKNIRIPQEVLDQMPKNVELVYWDYGEHDIDSEIFDEMFKTHEAFQRNVWFCSCAWLWKGWVPFNRFSLYSMECAMKEAHKHGIKDHIVSLWGSDVNEGAFFSVLPSLYALRQYADGNFDEESIACGFKELYGYDFYDFMKLDLPNKTSRNPELKTFENVSKTLLYSDCFLGWRDSQIAKLDDIPYEAYAEELSEAGKRVGEYKEIFDNLSLLCRALAIKGTLGVRTRKAYQSGDKVELKKLVDDYEETAKRIKAFTKHFRTIWLKENKPFGWECHQARLGGLHARVLDCRDRLLAYLNGQETTIPELEEEILPYAEGVSGNSYRVLVSTRAI